MRNDDVGKPLRGPAFKAIKTLEKWKGARGKERNGTRRDSAQPVANDLYFPDLRRAALKLTKEVLAVSRAKMQ